MTTQDTNGLTDAIEALRGAMISGDRAVLDRFTTDQTELGSYERTRRKQIAVHRRCCMRMLCGSAGAYMTGQTLHINGGVVKSAV